MYTRKHDRLLFIYNAIVYHFIRTQIVMNCVIHGYEFIILYFKRIKV
jgi:hypothetical protein